MRRGRNQIQRPQERRDTKSAENKSLLKMGDSRFCGTKPGTWPRLKQMILPSMILSFKPFHANHQMECPTLVKEGQNHGWQNHALEGGETDLTTDYADGADQTGEQLCAAPQSNAQQDSGNLARPSRNIIVRPTRPQRLEGAKNQRIHGVHGKNHD